MSCAKVMGQQSLKLAPNLVLVTYLDDAQSCFGAIAEGPRLSKLRQAWYVHTCPEIFGTEE